QWFRQCANWLLGGPHNKGLAVGHPSFQSASVVGGPAVTETWHVSLAGIKLDGVVNLRAGSSSGLEAKPDLHALNGLDGHDGLSDPSVQFLVPLSVGAESKGKSLDADFDDTPKRVSSFARGIDEILHLLVSAWIQR